MKAKKKTFCITNGVDRVYFDAFDFDDAFDRYLCHGQLLGASKEHNVVTSVSARRDHKDTTDDYGFRVQG